MCARTHVYTRIICLALHSYACIYYVSTYTFARYCDIRRFEFHFACNSDVAISGGSCRAATRVEFFRYRRYPRLKLKSSFNFAAHVPANNIRPRVAALRYRVRPSFRPVSSLFRRLLSVSGHAARKQRTCHETFNESSASSDVRIRPDNSRGDTKPLRFSRH